MIEPGAWSSQRHWHSHEDQLDWVVEGELTLVTDAGEEILCVGDGAAFMRGEANGHHLINKGDRPAKVLEIGNADPQDVCTYPDIDMIAGPGPGYRRRNGRLIRPSPRAAGPEPDGRLQGLEMKSIGARRRKPARA